MRLSGAVHYRASEIMPMTDLEHLHSKLYQVPEIVAPLGFPNQFCSDSYLANEGGSPWRYRFGEISTHRGCGD